MRYAEHAPAADLAPVVRCFWVLEDADADPAIAQPIVGDGCPELIVHFGAPPLECGTALLGRAAAASEALQPRALVAGQLTRAMTLRPRGAVGVLGIRFHPWSARRVLRLPLAELTDRRVDLALLLPGAEALADAIARCGEDRARIAAAAAFLRGALRANDAGDDPLVAHCVTRLGASLDGMRVGVLADRSGLGRRQLERRFADRVGVSPRRLGAILRLRRFFDHLEHAGGSIAGAAFAAGYCDQSHLTREFRRHTGSTPRAFLAARPAIACAILEA